MELNEILEHTKETYNSIAILYKETFIDEMSKKEFDRNILDRVIQNLYSKVTLNLDIGCGSAGHIGRYVFDHGFNVMGIDISPACIEEATKVNPKMSFRLMNMLQLDFPDSSIQAIFAFYSIIHIPKNQLTNLFNEFYRVLVSGGYLVLAVHEGTSEEIVHEILGKKSTLYVSFFTEQELTRKLESEGYKIDYSFTRKPYSFEHQTNRIYIIAKSLKN